MRVVLWDTRRRDVNKDFAGGFGVGNYHGQGGLLGRVVRRYYKRDRRPNALAFAYLAAIFRRLGHHVEFAEDRVPLGADVYVFLPALITLSLEREAISRALAQSNRPRVLVMGIVAQTLPEAFAGLEVTLVRGEPESLNFELDRVLAAGPTSIDVGSVANLDSLPFPDWTLFSPRRYRIAYDFWKFPTAYIQQSRGCTFTCNYCPYIVIENKTRFRSPESVLEEIRLGILRQGFRSFKFRDPLFGLDRKRALAVAEGISRLPNKIQFSIESRVDLLREETLRALAQAGLTSVTVGIETPDECTLREYKRAPIQDDRQREFVDLCRRLGIRVVAGFMIGFPADTVQSIRAVRRYAKLLGPTFANFNVVTPYPGTEFFAQVRGQIADFDFTKYDVFTPVLKYERLTADQVRELHAMCFRGYYFRAEYIRRNATLLWPILRRFGFGKAPTAKFPDGVRVDEAETPNVHHLSTGPLTIAPSKAGSRSDSTD